MKSNQYWLMAMAAATLSLGACNDWDEHYSPADEDNGVGTATIYEQICARAELSDFKEVIDSVRLFANNRVTPLHYKDLLNGDQFYSVWAPRNGSFNKDSLLQLCQTVMGDSLVEQHFVRNHMARFRHSAVANTEDKNVLMNNQKTLALGNMKFGGKGIVEPNVISRNGILHVLDAAVDYRYNIYEALVTFDAYKGMGDFLRSYQMQEFDETNSLAMGVVDGKTIYVDSVFINHNQLLFPHRLDAIQSEDSTFYMVVPTPEVWDSVYAEAASYYNYASTEKADSMANYWSHYSVMQDMVFNPTWQKDPQDSLWTTSHNNDYKYHVYYNPFAPDGVLGNAARKLDCSNGTIYEVNYWPYSKEQLYFKPIKMEGEGRLYDSFETSTKTLTLNRRFLSADTVSNGYLDVVPQTVYDPYYLIYEISGVLSGEYDVCLVMLPKTVYNPAYDPQKDSKQFKPNKFIVELTYAGTDGKEYTLATNAKYIINPESPSYYVKSTTADAQFIFECNTNSNTASTRAFTNNPYGVDTIKLATVKFPTCNYDCQKVTNRLKITNNIRSNQTQNYNAEMFIDCIYLKPHKDENY